MMKKREDGYLTVEATISLTFFLFFLVFLMNFGHIYRAQNYVTHGIMQTGKYLSFSSFTYEQVSATNEMVRLLTSIGMLGYKNANHVENLWRSGLYSLAVKSAFQHCASENPSRTDFWLKKYGLKNGVDSIDFQKTKIEGNHLVIEINYDVDLPFKFFHYEKITLHQRVVYGLWK